MEELNENKSPNPQVNNQRVIIGAIAILFGVMIMASNFGFMPYDIHHVIFSWPMILIVIGVIQLLNNKEKPTGYILLAIGFFFLMPKIFYFNFNFMQMFWPILLMVVGISLIFFHRSGKYPWERKSTHLGEDKTGSSFLDEINVFAGSKRRIANQEFKGGRITNIFGGTEINLAQADLPEGRHVLEVTCIFGGVSLVVPSDWSVHVDVISIFGAFEDKRTIIKKPDDAKGQLIVKGVAIFGGGDIKSY